MKSGTNARPSLHSFSKPENSRGWILQKSCNQNVSDLVDLNECRMVVSFILSSPSSLSHHRDSEINLIGICKLNWSGRENDRLYHNDLIMIQSQLARQVMGDKSGPVVFLSEDSQKPMNIHPCSNSIVPIHGRSEYVKKLWNTTFISHLFSCHLTAL